MLLKWKSELAATVCIAGQRAGPQAMSLFRSKKKRLRGEREREREREREIIMVHGRPGETVDWMDVEIVATA